MPSTAATSAVTSPAGTSSPVALVVDDLRGAADARGDAGQPKHIPSRMLRQKLSVSDVTIPGRRPARFLNVLDPVPHDHPILETRAPVLGRSGASCSPASITSLKDAPAYARSRFQQQIDRA